jgi:nucleotide-binding universal stress UspA family protein
MDSILVLVDLTPASSISINHAIKQAKNNNAEVTIMYVAKSSDEAKSDELKIKFDAYKVKFEENNIKHTAHIGTGSYKQEIISYVNTNRPDMVFVATHGASGIKQSLFGSNIYNLIKELPVSTLVCYESSSFSGSLDRILMPVASHANYISKVEQSCELISNEGKIIIFNVVKAGVPIDKSIVDNIDATKNVLSEKGVNFEMINIESTKFSIGYSKEILDYAANNDIDLISIMTATSDSDGGVSLNADKELLLLNKQGISVLCAR